MGTDRFLKATFFSACAQGFGVLLQVVRGEQSLFGIGRGFQYTCMIKVGQGKDTGQLQRDHFLPSADHKVVVCRNGHGYHVRRVVSGRDDLLMCGSVPE